LKKGKRVEMGVWDWEEARRVVMWDDVAAVV
jgi:hypothetical protein